MFQLMIVDDELSVLEGLAYTIPWDSIDVDTVRQASSADRALELLEQHHVDIVITDIRMPGMSGLELIRRIRERWSGIRCIILSGHGEFEYAQEAIRADTSDFLLKPIQAEEMIETVKKAQDKLREEWRQVSVYRETAQALREHMPLLRNNLLGELLHGRVLAQEHLVKKLELLAIPFRDGDTVASMIVRLEEEFYSYDEGSMHLLEYAVCNITEEIFGKQFDTWHFTDSHGYLVFLVRPHRPDRDHAYALIERLATQLHQSVQKYLKGNISVMLSPWGRFPGELRKLYEASLQAFRRRIGHDSGWFYSMGDEPATSDAAARSLEELHRFPTLSHLLETGNWTAAGVKIASVLDDLQRLFPESREHLMEVYSLFFANFAGFVHQNGRHLAELADSDWERLHRDGLRSIPQLQEWSTRVLRKLREDAETSMSHTRLTVMQKVNAYIDVHMAKDVSLQAIADHIHLHPVYLSRLYKQETGETISDYIHRLRMEKAAALLGMSGHKVYEVAEQTGYEPAYFNRVFKKYYGVTPQEYREGRRSGSTNSITKSKES